MQWQLKIVASFSWESAEGPLSLSLYLQFWILLGKRNARRPLALDPFAEPRCPRETLGGGICDVMSQTVKLFGYEKVGNKNALRFQRSRARARPASFGVTAALSDAETSVLASSLEGAAAGGAALASDEHDATHDSPFFLHASSQLRIPSHARMQSVIFDWHSVLHCCVPARASPSVHPDAER